MAVPKKKTSKSAAKVRQSAWVAREQKHIAKVTKVTHCPETGEAHLSHRVSPATGKYRGRQVLAPKKSAAEKTRIHA